MEEKYYRPILKNGDHLISSKENPNRVRGLARDANNHNPDIPEWEEVEIGGSYDDRNAPYFETQPQTRLSPTEEKLARAFGEAITAGSVWLIDNKIAPWWRCSAWPWLYSKGHNIKSFFVSRKHSTDRRKVKESEAEVCAKRFNDALDAYIGAIKDENLQVSILDDLIASLDEIEAKQGRGEAVIEISTSQLSALLLILSDYTQKLAATNGIPFEEINNSEQRTIISIRPYLEKQREMMETAS